MIKVICVIGIFLIPSLTLANPLYDTKLLEEAPISVFERALDVGVSPHSWDSNILGQTPLWFATWKNRIDLVDLLLSRGADINALVRDGYYGESALWRAAFEGHLDMVKHLVNRGADVNSPTKLPLIGAMSSFSFDPVSISSVLLSNGANTNAHDPSGKTPVTAAAKNFKFGQPLLDLFEQNGADLSLPDREGMTALATATEFRNPSLITHLLRKQGITVRGDLSSELILNYTIRRKVRTNNQINSIIEAIDILLANGADINATDADGNTFLHLLVSHNQPLPMVIEHVIRQGADVQLRNKNGLNIFEEAANGLLLGHPVYFFIEELTSGQRTLFDK
jgi:ankyrin repeat protein